MNKRAWIIMILLIFISCSSYAQRSQTVFFVDSRIGYTTNSYLNPFFAEWNSELDSGYGLLSGFGQTTFFNQNNALELTGGLVLEPFFEGSYAWKGGLGLVSYKRKISPGISLGLEGGGSYFNGTFQRSSFWALPQAVWFPTLFTSITVKAGSNFRSYTDFGENNIASSSRFDLYGVEFETWPSYNWQIGASLYGSLDILPEFQKQFSSAFSLGYSFRSGALVTLHTGFEQYQFENSTQATGGQPQGGPPFGGPPAGGGGSGTVSTESDRIFRMGITGSIPVNKTFSIIASAQGLQRQNTVTEEINRDLQVSGGIRILLQPKFRTRPGEVAPEWEEAGSSRSMRVNVQFPGEGRLYLTGDFNNWNPAGIPLIEKGRNRYVAQLQLEAGAYEYKILHVKGDTREWLEFSDDVYTVDDGFGGENGLLFVE